MSKEVLDPRLQAALQTLEEVPPRDPRRAARARAVFLAEARQLARTAPKKKTRLFGVLPVSFPLLPRLKGRNIFTNPWQEVTAMPAIAIILLAVAVFTGGTAATVYAADQAVPGEPLYAVDVAVEQLRLALTTDPAAEAELHLRYAQERLAEIQALAQSGNTEAIAQAAENLAQHLAAAQQAVSQVGQPELALQMQQVAQQAENTLQQVPVPVAIDVPVVAATPSATVTAEPSPAPSATVTPGPNMTPPPTEETPGAKVEFTGTVESMDGDTWVIDGQTVIVTNADIEGNIQVGDTVKVEAYLQADGSLWADEISLTDHDADATATPGAKVEFTGTVESMDGDTWVIDGQTVIVTNADIEGNIQVGDIVKVEAYLQADGSLWADEIEYASDGSVGDTEDDDQDDEDSDSGSSDEGSSEDEDSSGSSSDDSSGSSDDSNNGNDNGSSSDDHDDDHDDDDDDD